MNAESRAILIVGSGHLALRIRNLAAASGCTCILRSHRDLHPSGSSDSAFDGIALAMAELDLTSLAMAFLVDDEDEHNLEVLIALISIDHRLPITASLFNENIAPHLRAAHPNIQVFNPARIAAPAFVDALTTPLTHTLRYTPATVADEPRRARRDRLIPLLATTFAVLLSVAVAYFHAAEQLSWLDALYFVVVTVSTVGYGDITLGHSTAMSKVVGIILILGSTFFIWMIFSLTVDTIIKRRVQLALGRKKYSRKGHVIMCGLGRLGYFICEGLLDAGEKVLIVEKEETSAAIDHFRSRGAEVYIGDARMPRVLLDVGVTRAKALYSVVDNDFTNLEIGLNARSFAPVLRLILRIYDESMSGRIKDNLDIHLTFSMTAIADEKFFQALPPV